MNSWLACGVAGTALDDGERRLLEGIGPGGVVLFARNVASVAQVQALTAALRSLPSRPYVAIDLEGGRVNRLVRLLGDLPSAGQAARAGGGAVAALGRAAGAACAALGIGVDFAPVLDVERSGGYLGGEGRCFGDDPGVVADRAGLFLAALEAFDVACCLKHYPGLGSGEVDSHRELPQLGDRVGEERRVFAELASPDRAVMVAHALAPSLGDGLRPASLSDVVIAHLRRVPCGPVIADDLEMGALDRCGSLGERAAAALLAGCDQVLVCNALDRRAEVVGHVEGWARRAPELAAALSRSRGALLTFGKREPRSVPWEEAAGLAAEARRLAGAAS